MLHIDLYNFPNTIHTPFILTSPETPDYNCIAWAFGDNERCYWPDGIYYWPDGITHAETLAAFIELYSSINYEVCDSGILEEGYEKIAIFALNNSPTHAARQLTCGNWTSKLGESFDVMHTIASMNDGPTYGNATVYMKRPRQ